MVNLFDKLRAGPTPEFPPDLPTSVTPEPSREPHDPDGFRLVVEAAPAIATSQPDGILFYDFETVPDESRFPRPTDVDPSATTMPDLDVVALFRINATVEKFKGALEQHPLAVAQYEALIAYETATAKPRDGVLKLCRSKIVEKTSVLSDWCKEHSVNPMKARICAFGWAIGNGPVQSMTANHSSR